jgi:hypothetical protein
MNTQYEPQCAKCKHNLEELAKQLLDASIYFDIWEKIWPTPQIVDTINEYRGFFLPASQAILDQFFIKICNVLSNDQRAPSFYKVFKILDENLNLVPTINVKSLRIRLKQHNKTIIKINNYRKTRAAHWDIDATVEKMPVLYGEVKKMLKELQDVYNEILGGFEKGEQSFELVENFNTTGLLNVLSKLRIIRKLRISEIESILRT